LSHNARANNLNVAEDQLRRQAWVARDRLLFESAGGPGAGAGAGAGGGSGDGRSYVLSDEDNNFLMTEDNKYISYVG